MARGKFPHRSFDSPRALVRIIVAAQNAILGQQADGLSDLPSDRPEVMRRIDVDGVETVRARGQKDLVSLLDQRDAVGESEPRDMTLRSLEARRSPESGLLPVERLPFFWPVFTEIIGKLVHPDHLK